jgi:hypothetical protein
MTTAENPIQRLASLLSGSKAKPLVVPSRLAPSPLYDLEYRTSIIAMIFQKFAKPYELGLGRRILSSKLKLLQFVAMRPWILPAVQEWSKVSAQGSLALTYSIRVRRGFLSDTAHEDVINYLTACGMLIRQSRHLVSGTDQLEKIATIAIEQNLFDDEIRIISDLEDLKLTTSMLEGW